MANNTQGQGTQGGQQGRTQGSGQNASGQNTPGQNTSGQKNQGTQGGQGLSGQGPSGTLGAAGGQDTMQQARDAGRERNTIGQTGATTSQQTGSQQTGSQQTDFRADYWRDQLRSEPYYQQGRAFEDYEPAYRAGEEGRSRYAGQRFEDIENALRGEYERGLEGRSGALGWSEGAGQAARAAWDRADLQSADRDMQSNGMQSNGMQSNDMQSTGQSSTFTASDRSSQGQSSTLGGAPTGKR